jgi:hypothetical protein
VGAGFEAPGSIEGLFQLVIHRNLLTSANTVAKHEPAFILLCK